MSVSMNLHDCREKDRERAEIEAAIKRFRGKVRKVPSTIRNNYVHRALVLPGSIDHTRGIMGREKDDE